MTADRQASRAMVSRCAHGALVELAGEQDNTARPALRRVISPLMGEDELPVMVDLSRVTMLDTSIMDVLADLRRAVTERGGEFRVQPGNVPAVIRVLELAGWLTSPRVPSPRDNHGLRPIILGSRP